MRVLDYVLFYAAIIIGVPAICDFSRNQKTEKRGRNFGGFSWWKIKPWNTTTAKKSFTVSLCGSPPGQGQCSDWHGWRWLSVFRHSYCSQYFPFSADFKIVGESLPLLSLHFYWLPLSIFTVFCFALLASAGFTEALPNTEQSALLPGLSEHGLCRFSDLFWFRCWFAKRSLSVYCLPLQERYFMFQVTSNISIYFLWCFLECSAIWRHWHLAKTQTDFHGSLWFHFVLLLPLISFSWAIM